jgi:hypothetical protein
MFRAAALRESRLLHHGPTQKTTKHRKRATILYDMVQDDAINDAMSVRCSCAENCVAQFSREDVLQYRNRRFSSNANEDNQRRYHVLHAHVVKSGKTMVPLMHRLVCIHAFCVLTSANPSTGEKSASYLCQ